MKVNTNPSSSVSIPPKRIISLKEGDTNSLQCGLCEHLPLNPFQCTKTGSLLCPSCCISIDNNIYCPKCIHLHCVCTPPKFVMQFIKNLKVGCKYSGVGCKEIVCYGDLKEHEGVCGYYKGEDMVDVDMSGSLCRKLGRTYDIPKVSLDLEEIGSRNRESMGGYAGIRGYNTERGVSGVPTGVSTGASANLLGNMSYRECRVPESVILHSSMRERFAESILSSTTPDTNTHHSIPPPTSESKYSTTTEPPSTEHIDCGCGAALVRKGPQGVLREKGDDRSAGGQQIIGKVHTCTHYLAQKNSLLLQENINLRGRIQNMESQFDLFSAQQNEVRRDLEDVKENVNYLVTKSEDIYTPGYIYNQSKPLNPLKYCSASSDGQICVWSSLFEHIHTMGKLGGKGYARLLQLADGRIAATSGENQIELWDPKSGEHTGVMGGHEDMIWSIINIGAGVATASNDRTIKIWDLRMLERGGKSPNIYNPSNHPPTLTRTITGHTDAVLSLMTETPTQTNTPRLISGSQDKTMRIWDPSTGLCSHIIGGFYGRIWDMQTLGGRGKILGVSDNRLKSLRIINVWKGEGVRDYNSMGSSGYLCACKVDYDLLALGGNKVVDFWNTKTRCFEEKRRIGVHGDWIRSIILLGETHIATTSFDATIKVTNARNGKVKKTCSIHKDFVNHLISITY